MKKWWLEKPMRLIQTNLREIDASLNVDELLSSLNDFSANALLFNVGGIVANYPTELPFHYTNPYLQNDLVGKVVERVQEEGIRFIGRFDFSKVNEVIAKDHPEWLYESVAGQHVNYNGQVHVCVNSYYQQEYSLRILDEVLEKYPLDGVFFNMIGYVTEDYSYNYHGICQCSNCRNRFQDRYGLELPTVEDVNDPVFRIYSKFKEETCKELFDRIAGFIKSKRPDVAICTYTHDGVDIYRKESNSGIDRLLPEWTLSAGENIKSVEGSWDNMVVSNSAVHFVDFHFRHSGVPPSLTALRIAQNIANGGWLDYYVIGTLNNQDDRMCFPYVKELFQYHKTHEDYFTGVHSAADVCMIVPKNSSLYGSMDEFRGISRILTAAHIPFDLIHDSILSGSEAEERLSSYKVVILPDMRSMGEVAIQAIDDYVAAGGRILATGFTSSCDAVGNQLNRLQLQSIGLSSMDETIKKARGPYFRIRKADKEEMKGFDDLDIVYLYEDMFTGSLKEHAKGYLGYMPPCMFGPPEKCYYTEETNLPGIVTYPFGQGKTAFLPWNIGRIYQQRSNHAHALILKSVLLDLLHYQPFVELETSPLVEIVVQSENSGKWSLVHLVNQFGQFGSDFFDPPKLYDIKVRLKADQKPQRVHALKSGLNLSFDWDEAGQVVFTLPKLSLLETIVLE